MDQQQQQVPKPRGRGRGFRPTTAAVTAPTVVGSTASGSTVDVLSNDFALITATPSVVTPITTASSVVSTTTAQRLTSSSDDSGTAGGTRTSATKQLIQLARRPDLCMGGATLQLRCNFFEMNVRFPGGKLSVHHYRVEMKHVKEKPLKKDDLRELFWEAVLKHSKLADDPYEIIFDGGNSCYSLKKLPLPGGSMTFNTNVKVMLSSDNRPCDYSVHFRYIGEVTFDVKNDKVISEKEQPNIGPVHMLDLVMHHYYSLPHRVYPTNQFAEGGRSFYYIPQGRNDITCELSGGRQVWKGYFASAKLCTDNKLFMNIDTSNGIFYAAKSVLGFLCDSLNMHMKCNDYQPSALTAETGLTENERRFFRMEIKGLKVKTTHLKNNERIHKVRDITNLGADKMMFMKRGADGKDDQQVSVAQYFSEVYGALMYPRLPCLVVGSKNRSINLPIEMCDLHTPQKMAKKPNEEQTSTLIKAVCMDAIRREQSIREIMQKASFQADPYMRNFGVQVSHQMVQVEGRRLPTPKILFNNNRTVDPREGVWSCDRNTFYDPASMVPYSLLSMTPRNKQQNLEQFFQSLAATARTLGLNYFDMPRDVDYIRDLSEIEGKFNFYKSQQRKFVFVIMDRKNAAVYAEVKRLGDVTMGLMTQCLQFKTVMAGKPMTLQNILLKVNAKLDGINCRVSNVGSHITPAKNFFEESSSTMVIGIDVTHPGPTDRRSPSIAAVVANTGVKPERFGASIVVQKFRREAVVCMSNAIKDRIFDYFRETGRAPRRMIVYRDGVSEGQFNEILGEELTNIRGACMELDAAFRPTITVIVVQKRHHVRFFCANPNDQCGKAGNIPPGTVVDKVVVHPQNFDFYLCSHFGIQGTSRPAHYHVIHDENKFNAEEIQTLTYQLCHMYARCTRSVSIPAPVYYAHLACARAKSHLLHVIGDMDNMSSHSGATGGSIPEESLQNACKLSEFLRGKMYFV